MRGAGIVPPKAVFFQKTIFRKFIRDYQIVAVNQNPFWKSRQNFEIQMNHVIIRLHHVGTINIEDVIVIKR
jgi:hypothetical protein